MPDFRSQVPGSGACNSLKLNAYSSLRPFGLALEWRLVEAAQKKVGDFLRDYFPVIREYAPL